MANEAPPTDWANATRTDSDKAAPATDWDKFMTDLEKAGPMTDWDRAAAVRAYWHRVAEEVAREGQERFDRMSDEDWRKQSEEPAFKWDGPITMGSDDFLTRFPGTKSSPPPPAQATRREGAISKIGSWISKKLAFGRGSDIRHS